MPLPFLDRAEVSSAKIRDYLLNPEHPVGAAKARFFASLGFHRARWPELRAALLIHAAAGEVHALPPDEFGQRYIVRGTIKGPTGTTASLLAVWILTDLAARPRLITAYPEESR